MERETRMSEDNARNVIERIVTDSSAREALLPVFVESIDRAHYVAAHKWGITVARDRVRLNVGMIVVCTLYRGAVWLALEGAHDLSPLPHLDGWEYNGPYNGFPDMTEVYVFPQLHELTPAVQQAHYRLIEHAKDKFSKLRSTAESAHNDGALIYLEQILHRTLPRPLY